MISISPALIMIVLLSDFVEKIGADAPLIIVRPRSQALILEFSKVEDVEVCFSWLLSIAS